MYVLASFKDPQLPNKTTTFHHPLPTSGKNNLRESQRLHPIVFRAIIRYHQNLSHNFGASGASFARKYFYLLKPRQVLTGLKTQGKRPKRQNRRECRQDTQCEPLVYDKPVARKGLASQRRASTGNVSNTSEGQWATSTATKRRQP